MSSKFHVSGSKFIPLEADEQAAFFAEAGYIYRLRSDFNSLLLFATFNGEIWRSFGKVARGGLVRGVSDILYLQPRGGYPYFVCELKRADRKGEKDGGVTPAESDWLAAAKQEHAFTCVAYSADEALSYFSEYMTYPARVLNRAEGNCG